MSSSRIGSGGRHAQKSVEEQPAAEAAVTPAVETTKPLTPLEEITARISTLNNEVANGRHNASIWLNIAVGATVMTGLTMAAAAEHNDNGLGISMAVAAELGLTAGSLYWGTNRLLKHGDDSRERAQLIGVRAAHELQVVSAVSTELPVATEQQVVIQPQPEQL